MRERYLVSIIIPVYNVEHYIDRCLESVTNQTYKNLEILIMEGKSTDNSLDKVRSWAEKDGRIIVVSRTDDGLGDARNYAVNMSTGDYLLFLDADDRLSETFVEDTLKIAVSDSEIDMVNGNIRMISNGNLVDKIGDEWTVDVVCDENDKTEYMVYAVNFIWGRLFRKDFFTKAKILQPALPFEDLCVFPYMILMARKIGFCHSCFVFYEADREDALSADRMTYRKVKDVTEHAACLLRDHGLYDKYRDEFNLCMFAHARQIMMHCLGVNGYRNLPADDKESFAFMQSIKPRDLNGRYCVYGSFTLRWVVQHMICGEENTAKHFAFTNLIAQFSKPTVLKEFRLSNKFRQTALNDDYNGVLEEYLRRNEIDTILIDFLEEIRDIVLCEDGNYYTYSEAASDYENECGPDTGQKETIRWNSEEWWNLWQEACRKLIELLKATCSSKGITLLLVEDRFAPEYIKNDICHKYDINAEKENLLKKMYRFFEDNCESIIVCKSEKSLVYTDMAGKSSYPARPEYMNPAYYRNMARKIQRTII